MFTAFACSVFVVLGIVTTLLGPILPLVTARWLLSTSQAGTLFTWQFVFSTAGTLLSGVVFAKRSFKAAVVIGVLLCLVGVAALIFADWTFARYAVGCYGFGLGIALPAVNFAVAEANQSQRGASVSVLNFAWSAGAILGPLLLRMVRNLNLFLAIVSALLAISVIGSASVTMPAKSDVSDRSPEPRDSSVWNLVPWIGLSMFFLVGVENAIAGWASSLALGSFVDAFAATSATMAFWMFSLSGRAIAPIVLRAVSESALLYASIVLAAAGVLTFYFASHAVTTLVACALAGLGIGPGFPLLISRVSELIGPKHPASMVCFACAGIGAATLPNLVGVLGTKLSQPRAGLLLPFGALVVLPFITRTLSRSENHP